MCSTAGVLRYFNNSAEAFEAVAAGGEQAVLEALSAATYPDGGAANRDATFLSYSPSSGTVESASMAIWVCSSLLCNPGGIVLSDVRKGARTNLEFFYLRVLSCRALRCLRCT